MKARTTARLNMRRDPNTSRLPLATLPAGTELDVEGTGDWVRVTAYVARRYLQFEQPPPPPPGKRVIGHHVTAPGLPGLLLDHLTAMFQQNTPVPVVLTCAGGVGEIKRRSPATFVVARDVRTHEDTSPAAAGYPDPAGWFAQHVLPFARNNPGADAYQGYGLNEWWPGNGVDQTIAARYGQWYIGYMQAARNAGVTVTFGDIAVGNVSDARHVGEANHFEALRPMFAEGERLGHAFNYHAYSDPHNPYDMATGADLYAMRWLPWVRDYPRLRIVFGEAGPIDMKFDGPDVGFPGVAQTLVMWQQLQDMVDAAVLRGHIQAGQVVGACWWTLGTDPRWTRFDYAPALLALEEWARA